MQHREFGGGGKVILDKGSSLSERLSQCVIQSVIGDGDILDKGSCL